MEHNLKKKKSYITPMILNKYEIARLISSRAEQISRNSDVFVSLTREQLRDMDPIEIATQELLEKKIPLKVRRVLPNGKIEDIDIRDAIF